MYIYFVVWLQSGAFRDVDGIMLSVLQITYNNCVQDWLYRMGTGCDYRSNNWVCFADPFLGISRPTQRVLFV